MRASKPQRNQGFIQETSIMDSKHTCMICEKRFGCGRALGGHMRAHLAKLPLPPKKPAPTLPPSSLMPPSAKRWETSLGAASSSGSETSIDEDVVQVATGLMMMSRSASAADSGVRAVEPNPHLKRLLDLNLPPVEDGCDDGDSGHFAETSDAAMVHCSK